VVPESVGCQASPLFTISVAVAVDLSRAEVRLTGELDGAEGRHVEEIIDGLLGRGCRRVAIDLAGLGFLSCAGLTAFLRADREARAAGARVVLTRPTPMISRMLRLTGLDLVLAVHTHRDSTATAAPSGQPSSASRNAWHR
jgi:anti-sigma B factor antagonist